MQTLRIDGSFGEGGGQLVRTAVALAAITGRDAEIRNVRARRSKPGLAPQHLLAVRAVAALCGARAEGLALGSQTIGFYPGPIAGGSYQFDVGTAGSVTLVLQALLPAMLVAPAEVCVTIRGGTEIVRAPSSDYCAHVLLPLLARMGAHVSLEVIRHGYYPRGGGEVRVKTASSHLAPIDLTTRGALLGIEGHAHVAHLPEHIALRMRQSALQLIPPKQEIRIEADCLADRVAVGKGGAIVLWANFAHAILGAGRVAAISVRAEILGNEAAAELMADIECGATVDVHAADQLLIYAALARGGAYLARAVTPHAATAMWLIEQFLPVRFSVAAHDGLQRVSVSGAGST